MPALSINHNFIDKFRANSCDELEFPHFEASGDKKPVRKARKTLLRLQKQPKTVKSSDFTSW
jgi:hypothetical protein